LRTKNVLVSTAAAVFNYIEFSAAMMMKPNGSSSSGGSVGSSIYVGSVIIQSIPKSLSWRWRWCFSV